MTRLLKSDNLPAIISLYLDAKKHLSRLNSSGEEWLYSKSNSTINYCQIFYLLYKELSWKLSANVSLETGRKDLSDWPGPRWDFIIKLLGTYRLLNNSKKRKLTIFQFWLEVEVSKLVHKILRKLTREKLKSLYFFVLLNKFWEKVDNTYILKSEMKLTLPNIS